MTAPHYWPQVGRHPKLPAGCDAQGRYDTRPHRVTVDSMSVDYVQQRVQQAAEACSELGADEPLMPMRRVDKWMLAGIVAVVVLWAVASVAVLRTWLA